MNALTQSNQLTPAVIAALGTLAQHQADAPASTFGAFLKFNGNTGEYTAGEAGEDIPYGTRLVADFTTMSHGWIAWPTEAMQQAGDDNGGQPLFSEHVQMSEAITPKAELPPMQAGVEYKYCMGCDFLTEDGARYSAQWEGTSDGKGGKIEALKRLRDKIVTHAVQGLADMEGAFPIVEIDEEHYIPKIKSRGTKFKPVLKIVGWCWDVPA